MRSRVVWLARPWFFLAIAVLAGNDHVWKAAWPGWWTGKLSDFAGLVVVGTLAAVVVGPGWGSVLAAVGFIGLKTVPGVAEGLSVFLGGVTRRDATDLIALAVLPPLWWVLAHPRPGAARRSRRSWQGIGLVCAVLVTTATSKVEPPTEDYLHGLGWGADGAFYAQVWTVADGQVHYLRSTDGGLGWYPTGNPPRLRQAEWNPDDDADWVQCASDGVCVRSVTRDLDTRPRREKRVTYLQRRHAGGTWVTETIFTDRDPSVGRLTLNLTDSSQLVFECGDGRIMARTGYGQYRQVDVVRQLQARR